MINPKIVDVSEVTPQKRTSPAARIVANLDGEFYLARQVAEMAGVHIETLRRAAREGKIKAPSKATQQGKLVIYLYTPEDVEEVKRFYGKD